MAWAVRPSVVSVVCNVDAENRSFQQYSAPPIGFIAQGLRQFVLKFWAKIEGVLADRASGHENGVFRRIGTNIRDLPNGAISNDLEWPIT